VAKRLHYEKKLDSAKSNMKCTWSILNEVLSRKKVSNNLTLVLKSTIKIFLTLPKLPIDFVIIFLILAQISLRKYLPPQVLINRSLLVVI
jgi:hypothetical protein